MKNSQGRYTNAESDEAGPPPLSSSLRGEPATSEGGAAVTIYQITLRDRETQTVVGYYNGAWTTDRRRALAFRRREAAEAHAARCAIAVRGTPSSSTSRRSLPPTST